MKTIRLRGKYRHLVAIVDDEDYGFLSLYSWTRASCNNGRLIYPKTTILGKDGRQKTIRMHRLVMKIDESDSQTEADHIDHDGLNNQKNNLRLCINIQNIRYARKRKAKRKTSSKYKGVTFDKQTNSWKARIYFNKKQICLGFFKDEKEAAYAYDKAAKEYFGEFAYTNFGKKRQKNHFVRNLLAQIDFP